MPGIAVKVDAIVEHFFAKTRFATGRGERTASFVSLARVEGADNKIAEQISDGLWFQDHGILSRAEDTLVPRVERFANLFARDAVGIELPDVKMAAQKISGTAAVRSARGHRETDAAGPFVTEIPVF